MEHTPYVGYVKHTHDAALQCMVGAHLLPLKLWDVLWLLQLEKQRWYGGRKDDLCCLCAVVFK